MLLGMPLVWQKFLPKDFGVPTRPITNIKERWHITLSNSHVWSYSFWELKTAIFPPETFTAYPIEPK